MKRRTAAMKEYLTAATSIANEMNKSCHRTCTLAHVSSPVNPTAKMLLGSGSSSRSPHLMLLNIDRWFFPDSSPPPLDPIPCSFSFSSCFSWFKPLLLFASAMNLMGLLGIWVLRSEEEDKELRWVCCWAGADWNGIGGSERAASCNMFIKTFRENEKGNALVLSDSIFLLWAWKHSDFHLWSWAFDLFHWFLFFLFFFFLYI